MDLDDDLINSIAPDVLRALASKGFFEELDNRLCPADPASPRPCCNGTYVISTEILVVNGFDPEDIADITKVLASRGACCDCEILFNVAEESRLRSQYWQARVVGLASHGSHTARVDG